MLFYFCYNWVYPKSTHVFKTQELSLLKQSPKNSIETLSYTYAEREISLYLSSPRESQQEIKGDPGWTWSAGTGVLRDKKHKEEKSSKTQILSQYNNSPKEDGGMGGTSSTGQKLWEKQTSVPGNLSVLSSTHFHLHSDVQE